MKKRWLILALVVVLLVMLVWPVAIDAWKKKVAAFVVQTWWHPVSQSVLSQFGIFGHRPAVDWVLAMIAQESSGKPEATNPADPSYGLMMITPVCLADYNRKNGKAFTVADLMQPEINLAIGMWYFDFLLRGYNDDYDKAVMAYNAGQGNIEAGRPHLEKVKTYLSLIQPQLT